MSSKADDNTPPEYVTTFPHYTEADINQSLSAFNACYLLPDKNIYRAKYNRKAVAAIWVQAIYFDMIMNAYKRTKDIQYKNLMEDIYQGNYDHYAQYDFDNGKVWFIYDDIMWWVISLGRAYELTGEEKYLNFSKAGFKRVWSGSPVVGDLGSYDSIGGGMYWRWRPEAPTVIDNGKMSCINYPTVIGAMTLYNATKDTSYLNKAKEIYDWSRANLFDTEKGRVADSRHGKGRPNWSLHVYNQATCIGAAMMLYKETGKQQYLDDAILTADYTKNQMCTNGFLPFENGIEQGIYNAIFAQYIIRLIEDGKQSQYLPWLRYNIDSGWGNRNQNNITHKDHANPAPDLISIESYDASGIPAFMQVIPPVGKEK
ncbi:alpha-1,6-mannanase [Bacteroidia bacterium]|nr:alpha-1,6-mannanase [Bacteroidia bacterium]GHV07764.1 alpha-1,6-mannanase [Bacteroidia bacterium]